MIVHILLVLSMFFVIMGALGINRFKGAIPKLLTSSMIDTMAIIWLIVALILESGWNTISVKLGVVLLFVMLTNPVINHVITKAAYEENKDD